jgi:formylglycine-generating enzyme required for sulfatase activity
MIKRKNYFCLLLGAAYLLGNHISARAEVGLLKVNCLPEAYIFIDGQSAFLGTTKKLEISIEAGKHTLTAEATGYLSDMAKIEILPDQTLEMNLVLVKADQDRTQMVQIPEGKFKFGIDADRIGWVTKNIGGSEADFKPSVPQQNIKLKSFYIDKYEVTNYQYKKFVTARNYPAPKHWRGKDYPREQDDYPVVNVSWHDAEAYCKWAGKRLPDEQEWEKAASGGNAFIFPWGRKFRDDRANTVKERFGAPTITGRYEKGVSKNYGCYDMAGNVWEWTTSFYKPYTAASDDGVDKSMRVVRGGSFKEQPFMSTSIYRKPLKADGVYNNVGFRCIR